MTREQLAIEFCKRLPDDTLQNANKAGFDALTLFNQRDAAFRNLAAHGVQVYGEAGRVRDAQVIA